MVGAIVLALVAAVVAYRTTRAGAPQRVTLAVLPFENLGGDPERSYLADGLTEETIASVGQSSPERVAVIGRRSMMVYRDNAGKSLAEIGRELGADYLLEGSFRAEGGRFRVTAKLIRAGDQVHGTRVIGPERL